MTTKYKYGMRLRGFSPWQQPMDGLVNHENDPSGRYYCILTYSRPLTPEEISGYELDDLCPIKSIRARTGLSQVLFAKAYDIPRRTIENWESGASEPPEYVVKLLARAVDEDFK